MLYRPHGGDACHVGQLLSGALQATGECLKDFDGDFRVFSDHVFHVTNVIFYDGGRSACFDCASSGLAENVAHLAKNRARIHEHVEHDIVFVDFDRTLF